MAFFTYALDLVDDPALIAEYEQWHQPGNGWPEIAKSIRDAGIVDMRIYRTGNRLFLTMKTDATFSPERKAKMDAENPRVQEWEALMSRFQETLPWAKPGEKWVSMQEIFKL